MNNRNLICTKKPFDLSDELVIQRDRGGVRLVKPSNDCDSTNSIRAFNEMDASVYFIDAESTILQISPGGAEMQGLDNLTDVYGKNVTHYVKKDFASRILQQDREVIRAEQIRVYEDTGVRNDNGFVHCVTVRFPWFHDNKLVGIFGVSANIANNSLGNLFPMMNRLISSDLISTNNLSKKTNIMSTNTGSTYYSKREIEVIEQIIKGKSTKEIANILFISKRTAEHHIENIKLKANCRTRYELVYKMTNHNEVVQ